MTTERPVVTVGWLRAELAGAWPDDTPVEVLLPDRSDAGAYSVLQVVEAGLGDDVDASSDAVPGVSFPLRAAWPETI